MCQLSNDIHDYIFVSQGKTTIPNVDDAEELTLTDVSNPLPHENWLPTIKIISIKANIFTNSSFKELFPVSRRPVRKRRIQLLICRITNA